MEKSSSDFHIPLALRNRNYKRRCRGQKWCPHSRRREEEENSQD
ncbi:hypothetical protein Tco_1233707, partial [Tanacetum coccineum]